MAGGSKTRMDLEFRADVKGAEVNIAHLRQKLYEARKDLESAFVTTPGGTKIIDQEAFDDASRRIGIITTRLSNLQKAFDTLRSTKTPFGTVSPDAVRSADALQKSLLGVVKAQHQLDDAALSAPTKESLREVLSLSKENEAAFKRLDKQMRAVFSEQAYAKARLTPSTIGTTAGVQSKREQLRGMRDQSANARDMAKTADEADRAGKEVAILDKLLAQLDKRYKALRANDLRAAYRVPPEALQSMQSLVALSEQLRAKQQALRTTQLTTEDTAQYAEIEQELRALGKSLTEVTRRKKEMEASLQATGASVANRGGQALLGAGLPQVNVDRSADTVKYELSAQEDALRRLTAARREARAAAKQLRGSTDEVAAAERRAKAIDDEYDAAIRRTKAEMKSLKAEQRDLTAKTLASARATETASKSTHRLGSMLHATTRQTAIALTSTIALAAARAGLLTAFAAVSAQAIRDAAAFEQQETAFTSLLQSTMRGQKMLEDLNRFAADTQYTFDELASSTKRLMAYGFGADDALPMLRRIGDAVAALGGGPEMIDRITVALGQMRAKSKVSAEEMRQLAEAGIPAWEAVAKAIGKDIPGAMDQAKNGIIDSTTAINAILENMEQRFGGMMDRQSRTMLGRWTTFADNFQILMRDFGTVIVEKFSLKDAMGNMLIELKTFADLVKRTNLRTAIERAFDPRIITAFKVAITGLAAFIAVKLVSALVMMAKAIAAVVIISGKWILGLPKLIANILAQGAAMKLAAATSFALAEGEVSAAAAATALAAANRALWISFGVGAVALALVGWALWEIVDRYVMGKKAASGMTEEMQKQKDAADELADASYHHYTAMQKQYEAEARRIDNLQQMAQSYLELKEATDKSATQEGELARVTSLLNGEMSGLTDTLDGMPKTMDASKRASEALRAEYKRLAALRHQMALAELDYQIATSQSELMAMQAQVMSNSDMNAAAQQAIRRLDAAIEERRQLHYAEARIMLPTGGFVIDQPKFERLMAEDTDIQQWRRQQARLQVLGHTPSPEMRAAMDAQRALIGSARQLRAQMERMGPTAERGWEGLPTGATAGADGEDGKADKAAQTTGGRLWDLVRQFNATVMTMPLNTAEQLQDIFSTTGITFESRPEEAARIAQLAYTELQDGVLQEYTQLLDAIWSTIQSETDSAERSRLIGEFTRLGGAGFNAMQASLIRADKVAGSMPVDLDQTDARYRAERGREALQRLTDEDLAAAANRQAWAAFQENNATQQTELTRQMELLVPGGVFARTAGETDEEFRQRQRQWQQLFQEREKLIQEAADKEWELMVRNNQLAEQMQQALATSGDLSPLAIAANQVRYRSEEFALAQRLVTALNAQPVQASVRDAAQERLDNADVAAEQAAHALSAAIQQAMMDVTSEFDMSRTTVDDAASRARSVAMTELGPDLADVYAYIIDEVTIKVREELQRLLTEGFAGAMDDAFGNIESQRLSVEALADSLLVLHDTWRDIALQISDADEQTRALAALNERMVASLLDAAEARIGELQVLNRLGVINDADLLSGLTTLRTRYTPLLQQYGASPEVLAQFQADTQEDNVRLLSLGVERIGEQVRAGTMNLDLARQHLAVLRASLLAQGLLTDEVWEQVHAIDAINQSLPEAAYKARMGALGVEETLLKDTGRLTPEEDLRLQQERLNALEAYLQALKIEGLLIAQRVAAEADPRRKAEQQDLLNMNTEMIVQNEQLLSQSRMKLKYDQEEYRRKQATLNLSLRGAHHELRALRDVQTQQEYNARVREIEMQQARDDAAEMERKWRELGGDTSIADLIAMSPEAFASYVARSSLSEGQRVALDAAMSAMVKLQRLNMQDLENEEPYALPTFGEAVFDFARDRHAIQSYFTELGREWERQQFTSLWEKFFPKDGEVPGWLDRVAQRVADVFNNLRMRQEPNTMTRVIMDAKGKQVTDTMLAFGVAPGAMSGVGGYLARKKGGGFTPGGRRPFTAQQILTLAQQGLQIYGSVQGAIDTARAAGTEAAQSGDRGSALRQGFTAGGMSGLSIASMLGANPFGLAAGALLGGIFGQSAAKRAYEREMKRIQEEQLEELRGINNKLEPVADYFNRGAFGALTQTRAFAGNGGWAMAVEQRRGAL